MIGTTFIDLTCLIKQGFRKTRVNTLSEIAGVVKSYGWQQHLTTATATDQAVPALQVNLISIALYDIILII